MKVLMAIFDGDALMGRARMDYLQRSADIVRDFFTEETRLIRTDRTTDTDLCFMLDGSGPRFFFNQCDEARADQRRVGNVYYSRSFANTFITVALTEHGRLRPIRTRLVQDCLQAGNPLWHLIPRHSVTWAPILEDMLACPWVRGKEESLLTECGEHSEFTHMSMDCTLRIALRINGQAMGPSGRVRDAISFLDPARIY
jgi:hypothetical protein